MSMDFETGEGNNSTLDLQEENMNSAQPRASVDAAQARDKPKEVKLRSTCNGCQEAKNRCSREQPCFRCKAHDIPCIYSPTKRIGRPRNTREKRDGERRQPSHKKKDCESSTGESGKIHAQQRIQPQPESIIGQTPQSVSNLDMEEDTSIIHTASFPELEDVFSSHSDPMLLRDNNWPSNVAFDPSTLSNSENSHLELDLFQLFENPMSMPGGGAVLPQSDQNNHANAEPVRDNNDSNDGNMQQTFDFAHATSYTNSETAAPLESDLINLDTHQGSNMLFKQQNSSVQTPSVGFKSVNRGSSTAPQLSSHQSCDCYMSVLQRLLEFDDNRSNGASLAIDAVIFLEKSAHGQIRRVLQCPKFPVNHPDLLLLRSVAIDNIICMLEEISSL